jgi:hypothetical protein
VSILHNDLRDAGDEGLPASDMAQLGGRWWLQRVAEINRRKQSTIGEQSGRYYLAYEPGVEQTVSTQSSKANGKVSPAGDDDAGLLPRASAGGLLSVEPLTLFGTGRAHYDEREAA